MKLKVVREHFFENEVLGSLFIDDKFFCYTLEDATREKKIFAATCIPLGEYKVMVNKSTRFKRDLPLIYNQPDLTVKDKDGDSWAGVRMHGGNTHLDTEGCILVAANRYINKPSGFYDKAKKVIKNIIQGSMADQLTKKLAGATHTLEIVAKA